MSRGLGHHRQICFALNGLVAAFDDAGFHGNTEARDFLRDHRSGV